MAPDVESVLGGLSGKRVLITGACGFIGAHLGQKLLRAGVDVRGVDNFDPFYDRALKEENRALLDAAGSEGGAAFELREVDICEPGPMAEASEGADVIVHLAAKAGVRPSIADPVGYTRANLLGTSVVLESAKQAGCSKLIVASSSSVYGNNEKTPFAEDDPVEAPISPYASTKRATELLCRTHHHLTGASIACLRFFTVFGPRQRPDLAICKFLRMVGAGEAIPVFGDGSMSRDFTFVGDIVDGILRSIGAIESHGYRIWNLGHDEPVRLDEMIETVGRVVGTDPIIDRRPVPAGDVDRTWADLSRSRRELGYAPTVSLEEGMAQQWAWMREREASLSGAGGR